MPTVAIYTLRVRARSIALPRLLFTGFPRGQTLGPPNAPEVQREILRQALGLLETASSPAFYDRFDDRQAS
jgi:D-proline reductase (dithiol) PrdB